MARQRQPTDLPSEPKSASDGSGSDREGRCAQPIAGADAEPAWEI